MTRDEARRRQDLPDGVILALWEQGLDTVAIAKHLKCPEFQVFNRLLHVREEGR